MTLKWATMLFVAARSISEARNSGFCIGWESGQRAFELCRGFRVVRSVGRGFGRSRRRAGRNSVENSVLGERASGRCDTCNLLERKFWPMQSQARFQELSWTAQTVRMMSRFGGFVSTTRFPQNTRWPLFNHRSREKHTTTPGKIVSSGQQDGTADDNQSLPPLFMGNQLKKSSHFRDGIVHWCKYLEIKKDVRNYERDIPIRDQEFSTAGTQTGVDPCGVALGNSNDLTVICFDIETTGLSILNDRIIEFAARDLAGGVFSTIETLVNPGREVKNEYIHNISSGMVNNSDVPRWRDVALAMLDFVESRRKGQGLVILVAHNGKRFDVPFVMTEFQACGISIPSYWRFADSLKLARAAMKGSGRNPLPRTNLPELFTYYNLPPVGAAHRAMADVNMLAQVLQMLMIDLEMSTSELLAESFGADDIVLKRRDSLFPKNAVVRDVQAVDMAELDKTELVDNVNAHMRASVPWDSMLLDSASRSSEAELETTLDVKVGKVWKSSSQKFPVQEDECMTFQVPDLDGLKLGQNGKFMGQGISRAGAAPLRRAAPRALTTPPICPKKVDVRNDIGAQ